MNLIGRGAPTMITWRPNADVCCALCNPAALVDHERVGVVVERLGHRVEVCDACVEELARAKRLGVTVVGDLAQEAADIGHSFLNAGRR